MSTGITQVQITEEAIVPGMEQELEKNKIPALTVLYKGGETTNVDCIFRSF